MRRATALLLGAIVVLAVGGGCKEPTRAIGQTASGTQPALPWRSLVVDTGGYGDEQEIIGDTIWNAGAFYTTTTGGQRRANYLITLDTSGHHLAAHAGDSMFVRVPSRYAKWGWFTSYVPDCQPGHLVEQHDLNGDSIADGFQGTHPNEVHCLPAGEYDISLWRVTWNDQGTAITGKASLDSRKVALLDTLGSVDSMPNSTAYYDVHVPFDLNQTGRTSFSGDIRAADYWVPTVMTEADLYPATRSFAVASGTPLWFISTFVPVMGDSGGPPQAPPPPGAPQWYGDPQYTLTGFKFDYADFPNVTSGAINSVPGSLARPYRKVFSGTKVYTVVGNPTAPNGASADQDTITVSVTATDTAAACFTYSGTMQVNTPVTFDGGCSSGTGPLEYRWTFGDGSPVVDWNADSTVVHHTYTWPGQYAATLEVRVQGTSVVDDTSQTMTIAEPLAVTLDGTFDIFSAGYYTWSAVASGGAPPYHYRWYYRRQGQSEVQVGSDSYEYFRYVTMGRYTFILRVVVTDATQQSAQTQRSVQVGLYAPSR